MRVLTSFLFFMSALTTVDWAQQVSEMPITPTPAPEVTQAR